MPTAHTNSPAPVAATTIKARSYDPVALTINPTVTGMTVPEMLPAKFIASARNPAFRVAPIKVQAARDVKARAGLRGAGETKQQ
jgi:hypothetical protein